MKEILYDEILTKSMKTSCLILVIFVVLFLICMILFFCSKKLINNSKKHKNKKKENSSGKKEWAILVGGTVFIFLVTFSLLGIRISNCWMDLKNNSFVSYTGPILVEKQSSGSKAGYYTEWWISLLETDESISFSLRDNKYRLIEGEYIDKTVVYSQRSKILLDIKETEKNMLY